MSIEIRTAAETDAKAAETDAKIAATDAKAVETDAKATATDAKAAATDVRIDELNAKVDALTPPPIEPPPPPPPPPPPIDPPPLPPPLPLAIGQVTPTFDSLGNVQDSWWASLPLNQWLEVTGTAPLTYLSPLLPVGFQDFGAEKLSALFSNESGAAFDYATGRMWFMGGGHEGSSNNCMAELALERMAWRIAMQPSIYTQADLDYSKASWNASPQPWISFSQGYEYPTSYWNDGKPTALHTHCGLTWCPDNNKVLRFGRNHYWQIDPADGSFTRSALTTSMVDNSSVYDTITKQFYTFRINTGNLGYRKYAPLTDTIGPDLSTGKGRYTPVLLPIIIGRKIFCFQDAVANFIQPTAYTIDLDTGVIADVPLIGHPDRILSGTVYKLHSFESTGDYSPTTGLIYSMHKDYNTSGVYGTFTTIEPTSGSCGTYTPAGIPPPTKIGYPAPYSKFRIYERGNGTFMVIIHRPNANLHIVRLA